MSIYQDDSVKNLKFTNGSTDITDYVEQGSFSCENILCDDQLSFGDCNSARAQFVTITDLELTGKTITVSYGYGDEWANIGVFKVTQQTSKENSDEKTITMYDVMKNFDVDIADWYIGLTFPMTLLEFRNALCKHIGVTQESVTLVNDSMTVYETIAPSKLNAMDMMAYIGEINGVWPHASLTGTVEWLSLATSETVVPASVVQGADGVVQKDYTTSPISKLCVRSEDGDIGVTVGTGANTYYVTANVLVYGLTTEQLTPIATNLYNKIVGTSYTPTEIAIKADPTIKMGALLNYDGKKFYVLSRKTSGLLFDSIVSDGNQYLEEESSVETDIEQLRGKSNVLTKSIEGVSEKVTTIEEDYTTYSEFEQTTDEIKLTISEMEKELDGSTEIYNLDYQPTLTNYPYWDWTGLYPAEDLYPSDDLYFPYPATELQKHIRTLVFDTENTVTYRFLKIEGQFVWKELEDTETSIILSRLTTLEATTEGLSTTVAEEKVTLDDLGPRVTSAESSIAQNASNIELKVSSTDYNGYEIVSKINQSADTVVIDAKHIDLTGSATFKGVSDKADSAYDSAEDAITKVNSSIKSVTRYFAVSASGSSAPSNWSTTTQSVSASYPYLWQYETFSYNDGTTSSNDPYVASTYGTKGDKGETGATGAKGDKGTDGTNGTNGASVTSSVPLYYTNSTSTKPSKPTSEVTDSTGNPERWTTVEPDVNRTYPYVYTCVQTKLSNGSLVWSDVILATSNSQIVEWCSANDKTYIDGAKLYTGSVSSKQIDTDELFTQELTATNFNITGGSIKVTTSSESENFIDLEFEDDDNEYVTFYEPKMLYFSEVDKDTSTTRFTSVTSEQIQIERLVSASEVYRINLVPDGESSFTNDLAVGGTISEAGEDLSDRYGRMKSVIMEKNTSKNIVCTKNAAYTVIINGIGPSRKGLYMVYNTSSNDATMATILSASGVSVAPTGGKVTIANNTDNQIFVQILTNGLYMDRIAIS